MSPSPESSSPYRLDELGWLQFDRLCGLVLEAESGIRDLNWRGHSDAVRMTTVETPVALRHPKLVFTGPVTVALVWIRAGATPNARLSELAGRIMALFDELVGPLADELLLFTNLDTEPVDAMLPAGALAKRGRVTVVGADRIGASVDRHPMIRACLPSVLGLRDLDPLIDRQSRDRSSFDIPGAQQLAGVFWPTHAYEQARAVLAKHRFVVLTGPPEMGKTAIAEMLALAQLADGWEAHECTDPDQVWRVFDRDRRQVFIADDAFGSTEYRPDAAERWALALGRLLTMLDSDHWLIWTSRPAPLKAGLRRVQRERGSERFPTPGEVLVDASDLDLEEKTLILFRHAKARGLSEAARSLVRWAGSSIVDHPHFTPERIRRLVADRLEDLPNLGADTDGLSRMLERELASPTEAMRNSFNALAPEHRDLLVSLLDAPAGLIDERELVATVRRHHPGGLSRAPAELIDRLTDHFLRVTPLGIGWVHPSWRDLVIDQLHDDAPGRRRFLAVCDLHGVMLALSQRGGRGGERTLPLLVTDADWDQLGDRLSGLLHQLEAGDLTRLLLALEAAISHGTDDRARSESKGLAVYVLNATRRAWDQAHQPLPAFLLDAWYRLRKRTAEQLEAPQISATWVELHPGAGLLEHPGRDELLRADEWLAIAQVLQQYDRAELQQFGFYARDRELLAKLTETLPQDTAQHEETRALAQSVLERIEELVPELAPSAHIAIQRAGLAEHVERTRWWTPQDIPAPPSTKPVGAITEFTHRDAARVFDDL